MGSDGPTSGRGAEARNLLPREPVEIAWRRSAATVHKQEIRVRKRILFADEGPKAMRLLWSALQSQLGVWDMTFASSGADAVEAVENNSFDVVVCTIRLPDLDGAELLNKVKFISPHTLRVIMCPPDRWQDAMQISAAQQFLATPCVVETFENLITRTLMLHDLLREEAIRDAVGRIGQLPALPRVYSELTALMGNAEAGAGEVAEVMRQDIAMTAKVLQIVNSSFFALSHRVTDVRQAVAYLGFRMLKNLVLTAHLFGYGTDSVDEAEKMQAHACRVASLASRLVSGKQLREDAYTAGILHDAGKLVLMSRLTFQMREIQATVEATQRPGFRVEQEILGTSHAEIGGYLLLHWGLPMPIVEAVTHHHQPGRIQQFEFGLPTAVHVAEALVSVWEWENGLRPAHRVTYVDLDVMKSLGVAGQLDGWKALAAELCSRAEAVTA